MYMSVLWASVMPVRTTLQTAANGCKLVQPGCNSAQIAARQSKRLQVSARCVKPLQARAKVDVQRIFVQETAS